MAKTAPVQEVVTEKIELIDLTEEKATHKGFKLLFVIIPAAVATVVVATAIVVRRIRSKSEF